MRKSVACGAAHKDQGRKGQHIGVVHPLRLRQRGAQGLTDSGHRDGHNGAVDKPKGRGQNGRDQDIFAGRRIAEARNRNGRRSPLL